MSAIAETLLDLRHPGDAAQHIAELNLRLAREREISAETAAAVEEIVRSISETDAEPWLRISHELATHALRAVIDAQRAVARREEGLPARNELRSALGRLSQALGLIAEGEPVSPDRSAKEIARWLVETLRVPQREIAEVLDVPLRSFQRWASATEHAEPDQADADKLRLLAAAVNHLRFGLTDTGIIRWFGAENGWLDGVRPRDLLDEPLAQPRLVAAAHSLREMGD
jgi:hypothetical protein